MVNHPTGCSGFCWILLNDGDLNSIIFIFIEPLFAKKWMLKRSMDAKRVPSEKNWILLRGWRCPCSLRGLLTQFSCPNLSPLFSHRYFSVTGVCLRGGLVVFGVVSGVNALVSPGAVYQIGGHCFLQVPIAVVINNSLDQYFITILFAGENSSCLRLLVLCPSHLASKNWSTGIWQQ